MNARAVLGLGVLLIGAATVGALVASPHRRSPIAADAEAAASPTLRREAVPLRAVARPAEPSGPDLVAWYDSVRDDANPKPRLKAIEAWDRTARPDASLDLLTHALVDPDASIRERAQASFDRRMSRSSATTRR